MILNYSNIFGGKKIEIKIFFKENYHKYYSYILIALVQAINYSIVLHKYIVFKNYYLENNEKLHFFKLNKKNNLKLPGEFKNYFIGFTIINIILSIPVKLKRIKFEIRLG